VDQAPIANGGNGAGFGAISRRARAEQRRR
jgi:hypothetical protein